MGRVSEGLGGRLCTGILAHVDAGKTTLCEGLLYTCGNIRKLGRVDTQDAFLDTDRLERERGITIFSKQAVLKTGGQDETGLPSFETVLLDTPGHVDFSAEMERTLQVLDYAILVISGTDGVQGHTRTLWRLLEQYQVPVFLFINKMDRPETDREQLLKELSEKLSDGCVDFGSGDQTRVFEAAALCEEGILEEYLETGEVSEDILADLIWQRKLFPCYFGSALHLTGVEEFIRGYIRYTRYPVYSGQFGARVYKISRDGQGNRLTHLKVTGGTLRVRDVLSGSGRNLEEWQEKVSQIRIYSGEKYETADAAAAGTVCAVTGLTRTFPGQGLGSCQDEYIPVLEPVLTYQLILPPDISASQMLPKLRELEEEDPQLNITCTEGTGELQVQVMGEVQTEVLQSQIKERFDVDVSFGTGDIVYKETILDTVEGVGHYEPLRHYAEVHLVLEPGEPGSGMQFFTECSEDLLDKNWQRLILTHLEEKDHKGVLTGASLTDMQITVVGGRAHIKHTEGGDFRQATYRAVRQGLMQARSVLLEPYYSFVLEVPADAVGRAMTDLERMGAQTRAPEIADGRAVLTGSAPVSAMREYPKEVAAYTRGEGSLSCGFGGYGPCTDAEDVILEKAYDPLADAENPSGSVFCSHGAGTYVDWDQVFSHMHVEPQLARYLSAHGQEAAEAGDGAAPGYAAGQYVAEGMRAGGRKEAGEAWIGTEEVDAILDRTLSANRKSDITPHKGISRGRREAVRKRHMQKEASVRQYQSFSAKPAVKKEKYLLVDGYNNIFAWEELKELAAENMDGARGRLMDILCEYQAMKGCQVIVVFDAYRVKGHPTEVSDYHNIHVVFTAEAETADQYIEKFAHEHGRKYDVTVATSDGLEQIIIRGEGCGLVSAREFEQEIRRLRAELKTEYLDDPT